jgi:hypothetical protein
MKPFTELGLTLQQAKEYCNRNECLVCNGAVFIAFVKGEYVLRCGDPEHGPEQWGRPSSKPNMYQEANQIKRSVIEMAEQTENPTALSTIVHSGFLTQQRAAEIVRTFWPKAPDSEVTKAAILCESYGLNPLMKHVFLIPFKDQWALVMGISATRLIAQRQGDFSYLDDTPRIMTADEQMKAFGEVDQQNIWSICKIKNVKTGATAMGRGNWPKDKFPQGMDKGNTKANMAGIRAERQALDRLCPGKMPVNVEVIDENLVDLPDTVRQVDTATGQIYDTTAKTLPAAPAGEASLAAAVPPASSGALSDDLGTCPKHKVPWKQFTKKGTAIKFLAHPTEERDDKGKLIWCGKDKVEREMAADAAAQPADGEFTEQGGAAPGTEPSAEAGDTDASGGQGQDAVSASAGQTDQGKEADDQELTFESQAKELATALWGDNYRTHLNKFLGDNFGFKDLRSVKVEKRADIVNKLTDMVKVK